MSEIAELAKRASVVLGYISDHPHSNFTSAMIEILEAMALLVLPETPVPRWWDMRPEDKVRVLVRDCDFGDWICDYFHAVMPNGRILTITGVALLHCKLDPAHEHEVHPYLRGMGPIRTAERSVACFDFEVAWFDGTDPDGNPWPPVVNGRIVEGSSDD